MLQERILEWSSGDIRGAMYSCAGWVLQSFRQYHSWVSLESYRTMKASGPPQITGLLRGTGLTVFLHLGNPSSEQPRILISESAGQPEPSAVVPAGENHPPGCMPMTQSSLPSALHCTQFRLGKALPPQTSDLLSPAAPHPQLPDLPSGPQTPATTFAQGQAF